MKVEILADSLHRGHRLTTFRLTFPQIIVKEMLRHRMFSFASLSMRAIGLDRNIEKIKADMWRPLSWLPEHKGMCTDEVIENREELDELHNELFQITMRYVRQLQQRNVSHQIVNRYIEHFGQVQMIVSATEWENFYKLRRGKRAEQHIKLLAETMYDAQNTSTPYTSDDRFWHMPFVGGIEENVAKVARVSFSQDKVFTPEENKNLYKKLLASGEMSPFEHVAVAMGSRYYDYSRTVTGGLEHGWDKNFRGFISLRTLVENPLNVDYVEMAV